MLKAAAAAGADAVYLGLDRFNARSKAENFSNEFFLEALAYCHMRGIKVYVTFNTLIKEDEFDEAISSVDFVVSSGADGIIVQDFGIICYVAKKYPNFPLHISTQAGVCTKEAAEFMRSLGAKRVVLSRETSLSEVKRIAENVDIEIEYFVQGALCVCFSGNCYMSSIIDGNSGNRGRCAQVCRKKAMLNIGGKKIEGYNLSTKDTMLLDNVKDLVDIGVKSFKIEGRMRSPEYVYYAVKAYKLAIKGEKIPEEIITGLKTSFNRGDYSTAYINGRRSKVIYNKVNSNIGIKIGKVSKTIGKKAIVQSRYSPTVGDGFKVIRNGKEVGGGRYFKGDGTCRDGFYLSIDGLCAGDEIRLNYSERSNDFVSELERKVPIKINYHIAKDLVEIIGECNGFSYCYIGDILPDIAKSLPLDEKEFEKQFGKISETDFEIEKISGKIKEGLFYPKSALNEIRRRFFAKITEKYLESVTPKYLENAYEKGARKNYPVSTCVICNENNIDNKYGSCDVVLHPTDYKKIEKISITTEDKYLYVPCFIDDKDEKMLDEILKNTSFKGIYADGTAAVSYAMSRNIPYILGVCCNITNLAALEAFPNAVGFVNSKELNKNELLKGGMVLCKGDFINMTFVHCPMINSSVCDCSSCRFGENNAFYEDEAGRVFPLKRSKISGCLFYLLNNKKIEINGVAEYLYEYSFFDKDIEKELQDSSSNKGHYNKGIS